MIIELIVLIVVILIFFLLVCSRKHIYIRKLKKRGDAILKMHGYRIEYKIVETGHEDDDSKHDQQTIYISPLDGRSESDITKELCKKLSEMVDDEDRDLESKLLETALAFGYTN